MVCETCFGLLHTVSVDNNLLLLGKWILSKKKCILIYLSSIVMSQILYTGYAIALNNKKKPIVL